MRALALALLLAGFHATSYAAPSTCSTPAAEGGVTDCEVPGQQLLQASQKSKVEAAIVEEEKEEQEQREAEVDKDKKNKEGVQLKQEGDKEKEHDGKEEGHHRRRWSAPTPAPMAACMPDEAEMLVVMTTRSWGYEASWRILGTSCSGKGYSSHDTRSATCCMPNSHGSFTLKCMDSYGDGWNGGYLTIGGKMYCARTGSYKSDHWRTKHATLKFRPTKPVPAPTPSWSPPAPTPYYYPPAPTPYSYSPAPAPTP